MVDRKQQLYFLTSLLLVTLGLSALILSPFLNLLAIVSALVVIFNPLYKKVQKKIKSENTAAIVVTFIALLVVLIPILYFSLLIFNETMKLYVYISDNGVIFNDTLTSLEKQISNSIPNVPINLEGYILQALNWFIQNLSGVFTGILQLIFSLFIGLMAFYYLLKDGKKIVKTVTAMSPLPDSYDEEILSKLEKAINSIVKGALIIAIVQGILAAIGFKIFGVPSPALWGSITSVVALIPGLGVALVITPAIVYLALMDKFLAAFGLFLWGLTVVGLIDNILGPRLIKKGGVHVHPFLILISVLGGLGFFGPSGFLLGPLILSLLFSLISIYANFVNSKPL